MKIIKTLFILVMCSFVGSCATSQWQGSIVPSGTTNDAVNNAIIDFTHTSKLFKKDTVFSIVITDLNEDVLSSYN